MPREDHPQDITRADAAALLSCSTQTVDRYVRAGLLTAHKLGPRLVRLDRSEVEMLLTPAPEEWVRRSVDDAPPLSPARRARLAAILATDETSSAAGGAHATP